MGYSIRRTEKLWIFHEKKTTTNSLKLWTEKWMEIPLNPLITPCAFFRRNIIFANSMILGNGLQNIFYYNLLRQKKYLIKLWFWHFCSEVFLHPLFLDSMDVFAASSQGQERFLSLIIFLFATPYKILAGKRNQHRYHIPIDTYSLTDSNYQNKEEIPYWATYLTH